MVALFADSGDPDQMPHSGASDLGLHCLPFTLLGVSSLQWAKVEHKSGLPVALYHEFWSKLPAFQDEVFIQKTNKQKHNKKKTTLPLLFSTISSTIPATSRPTHKQKNIPLIIESIVKQILCMREKKVFYFSGKQTR